MKRPRRFERIGHRGAPRELLENTLASFERALERGAEALELDVHATADGVVVVHHDGVLRARIQSRGPRNTAIARMTWAELRSVDLGAGAHVPALDDVIDAVGRRAVLYVEIKGRGIEQSVADTISRGDCSCAVHSFDHGAIERMRHLVPATPRGLLYDRYPTDLAAAMARAQARDVWPNWSIIDPTLVDTVHDLGGRVIAWTVNDADVAARLVEFGVDGLCSDDLRHIR